MSILGKWAMFEAACALAALKQATKLRYEPKKFRAIWEKEAGDGEFSEGAEGGTIARDTIARAVADLNRPRPHEHGNRKARRGTSAESRARARLFANVCDYCHGTGEIRRGTVFSRCNYCDGSGREQHCSACSGTGLLMGKPCVCPEGQKRDRERGGKGAVPNKFNSPYEGTAGVRVLTEEEAARMLRRVAFAGRNDD